VTGLPLIETPCEDMMVEHPGILAPLGWAFGGACAFVGHLHLLGFIGVGVAVAIFSVGLARWRGLNVSKAAHCHREAVLAWMEQARQKALQGVDPWDGSALAASFREHFPGKAEVLSPQKVDLRGPGGAYEVLDPLPTLAELPGACELCAHTRRELPLWRRLGVRDPRAWLPHEPPPAYLS
jgi:hypothetical protein